jgi:predicted ribosome quality control (RQC) complex YloA/Tae2 family protein
VVTLKGALAEGKKAVSGFGDEVTKEFKAAADATKQLQQVEDAFNRLSVSRAKVNRDLAISKELLTDENASFEDKRKALDKIKKTEGEQTRTRTCKRKEKI